MDKERELEALLENVKGSYEEIVVDGLKLAKKYNAYDKYINFIKNTPNVTASDVVYFEAVQIFGIKPLTDEEKQAYLDSLKNEREE